MEGLGLKALGEEMMDSVGRLAEGDFNISSTTTSSRLHKSCMFPNSIDLFAIG